jgi:tetratricopeptide (TPR) repeat protein
MKSFIITCFIFFFMGSLILPCTMVMVAREGVILAGNNEDWRNPNTRMWIVPPQKGEYGRVCFGFDDNSTQGGMNDQGLFIDGNALARTDWQADPEKKTFQGNLMDYILAQCATVNEAIEFLKKYNFSAFSQAKFPIADAKGESVVVEYGQGKMQYIKRQGHYQISTNFVQSNFSPKRYPCHRYKIAETILKPAESVSVDLVRRVLSATHNEFFYPTVYSNIYDLKNKLVYLYNFHNFEEVVIIDLDQELKKGKNMHEIPSLFTIKTQAALAFERYSPKSGAKELLEIIKQSGVKEAIAKYHQFKTSYRKLYKYRIDEREINTLGYLLLNRENKIKAAIEIFKLNVEEHPVSFNVYDSLAEAYLRDGQKELAIKFYKKALELNPRFENARQALKKLQK